MKKLLILISIVAASMFATVQAAEIKTLYERTSDTWTDADLTEWVMDYASQKIDNGLAVTFGNTGWSTKKEITFSENSIVTLTASFTGGTTGNNGNYEYIELGGAQVRLNGQAQKGYISGISEEDIVLSGNARSGAVDVIMVLNQATKDIEVTVSGSCSGTASGKISSELANNVIFGYHKAGRNNTEWTVYLKNIKITEELQEVSMANYTVNYTFNGTTIKSEEGQMAVGAEVTATAPFTVDNQKYYFADGATTSMTIQADSENVLNVDMREAYVFNYTVKNNVNSDEKTGTCIEGESVNVPYSRYILKEDGSVWIKEAAKQTPYTISISPDKDDYIYTVSYSDANIANAIYFSEAEHIEGLTATTSGNAGARGSNAEGGYASEPVTFHTLSPGKYIIKLAATGSADKLLTIKADAKTVLEYKTTGSWGEGTSDEFTVTTETGLTFEGADAAYPLDYILIQKTGEYIPEAIYTLKYVLEGTQEELKTDKKSGVVGSAITLTAEDKASFYDDAHTLKYKYVSDDSEGKSIDGEGTTVVTITMKTVEPRLSWDFTKWSDATVANLKADENWDDDEKGDGKNVTDGKCFWHVDYTKGLDIDKNLMANGVIIEELEGLVYTNEKQSRYPGIAIDYPSTSLGEYHGPSYLWLGSKEINYFAIPDVLAGATIKMGVESHKNGDPRGVKLTINGEELKAPNGDVVEAPTTYEEQAWFVPKDAAASNNVTITNTNGCHIYYITVVPFKEVTGIAITSEEEVIETLTIKEGITSQLSAVFTPEDATDKSVTWESSDKEIATVDQTGKVTAFAPGEADITVTATNGISATCKVTVEAGEIVVNSITLEQTEATVAVGGELILTATVDPAEAAVTWSSSDEEVATVENGVVTGVAAGTATITASSGDKTATCTVTVTVPVKGIELVVDKLTVSTGEEFTLGYTIDPDDATDKTVTWKSNNEDVATVDENGKVTTKAAGEVTITAKAGEKEASCVITVATVEAVDGVKVKMTYIDGTNCVLKDDKDKGLTTVTNRTDKVFGLIKAGETAIAGYNKISGGSVVFGDNTWNVNYITYIQVDASAITDNYITSAILSFDASGSTDSKRTTTWGVGYNSSSWSSTMTYNTADQSITTLGDTKSTSTKSASTFENFSFDITEAINNAEGRIATILVYETAAAGGYIKNPTVKIESTNELVYNVTFKEKNEVDGVKVTVNDQDATAGMKLKNGTYNFTATADHYKDYEGEFTVSDEDLTVEFEMTPKAIWSYTVKNNVNDVEKNGTVYEGESASVFFNKYILAENGTVWSKDVANNKTHEVSFTPDEDGYVYTLEYSETDIKDGIFFKEAEDEYYTDNNVLIATATTGNRGSNKLGGYTDQESATLYTLLPGTYNIEIGAIGPAANGATLVLKAGEEEIITTTALYSTLGKYSTSEPVIITTETDLTIEGTDKNNVLDYILITGKVKVDVEGIGITDKDGNKLESIDLIAGETYQLSAAVAPKNATEKGVKWTSRDPDVATVNDNGLVTAVNGGSTIITVASAENEKITASVTVNVTVPLKGITLDETAEMTMGETLKLEAKVEPENATDVVIEWESNNQDVATVENGTVKAVGVGTATITATCGEFSAKCAVKVYPRVGDADWSGKITVTDAVEITNYVVEKKTVNDDDKEFILVAIDANGDKELSFADASAAAELALSEPTEGSEVSEQARIRAFADEAADALVVTRAANGYAVALENSEAYVALQADIFLPEGCNVDVKAAGRAAGSHSMLTRKHADNHIRVVFFNLSNEAFADSDAPMFEILTDSNISAEDIVITNIYASDADANESVLASKIGQTSGVAAIGLDENEPVKVFDVNGIYVGDTLEGLQQGTYIVRQGDAVRKLRVR